MNESKQLTVHRWQTPDEANSVMVWVGRPGLVVAGHLKHGDDALSDRLHQGVVAVLAARVGGDGRPDLPEAS